MERRVAVDGCNNFRDLGGYPTADGGMLRWRLLFRADGLHALSARGVATLRDEIRVGDIIDLRSSAELAMDGRGPLERESIRFHHLPLFDGNRGQAPASFAQRGEAERRPAASFAQRGEAERRPAASFAQRGEAGPIGSSLADLYFAMLDFAREPLARVVTTLARADAPAVFHCAAGKDRTGVVSALLLSLLGVREEIIVADYAATRESLHAIVERLMASEGYQGMFEALPPDTLHADPETMEGFLARVRREFGSMAAYADEIGVARADVERLRARLIAR